MGDIAYRIDRMVGSTELADITARLLGLLPTWFGIEESNAEYIRSATELPGLVARTDTEAIGMLLCRRHFPESAEIHVFAVDPAWHRRGVGSALVAALAADLRTEGRQVLQVKTLGPSHPDPGYAKTRAFYRAIGFLPIEEMNELWQPGTPCLIMVKWLA